MSLDERSYSGHLFRPRPEIHIEGDGQLVIIATPWGPRSSAKKVIQIILDFFHSSQQGEEATSPFSRLTCLSPMANDLRTSIKLANDALFNEDNKNEYVSGVELFVMARKSNQVVWSQIGYPFVFLDRPHNAMTAIGSQLDLSLEFSTGAHRLAPLPGKLLGIEASTNFTIETLRPSKDDKFLLVSRSGVPSDIFNLKANERNIEQISRLMSQNNPDLPYWLGLLNLTSA